MSRTHETLRRFYARLITATAGSSEPRLVDAFAAVERERFVGPGPWLIPVEGGYMNSEADDPAILYQDINIALSAPLGINNGQPSLHARCLAAAAPQPGDVVVHVGAGTGYYTAILSNLVGPMGRIYAYEISEDLADLAASNLVGYNNVTTHAASALEVALPSAEVIYVCAGVTEIPSLWLDSLTVGGRLVLPLTPSEGPGAMLMVTRRASGPYEARHLSPAFFIPCVGARNDAQDRALVAAIAARSPGTIRSLRRGDDPDATAWCVWEGWWLSTAAVDVPDRANIHLEKARGSTK